MNKMVKKAMAAVLALTIVGVAMPAITGEYDILKPAIVADAAETVSIANGACFHLDDTLDFGTGCYIELGKTGISQAISGIHSITDAGFYDDGENGPYGAIVIDNHKFACYMFFHDLSETPEIPDSLSNVWGFIVCGDGTEEEPYHFCPLSQELTEVSRSRASVALDDSISLNFYADKPSFNAVGVDSVILTGPNGQISYTTTSFEDGGNDNYIFRYPLYATQLEEDVTIQFKKGENTVKYVNKDSFSYKVNDYCDYIIEKADYYDEEEVNAVKSLKNLGLASNNYFDGTSNSIPYLTNDWNIEDIHPEAPDEVKFSLVLDSKLSARVYIPDLPDNSVSDDGNYTAVKGKGGKNCFEIKHINPADLDEIYNIKFESYDITFTPLAYCYRAIETHVEKNNKLAQAILDYHKYIELYDEWLHA